MSRVERTTHRGEVRGRRFEPNARDAFRSAFDLPDGTPVDVTVERVRARRSLDQNAWYWGCILPMIAAEMGEGDVDEVHATMKSMFNVAVKRLLVPSPKNSKRRVWRHVRVPQSTAGLSTLAFSEYCETVRRWAAEFLSLNIPDPVTSGYSKTEGAKR